MSSFSRLECSSASYADFYMLHGVDEFITPVFHTAARSQGQVLYFGKNVEGDEMRLESYGQLVHDPAAAYTPNLSATFWWKEPQVGLRIHPTLFQPLEAERSNFYFKLEVATEQPITAMRTEIYKDKTSLMFGSVAIRGSQIEFEPVAMSYLDVDEPFAGPALGKLVEVHAPAIAKRKVNDMLLDKLKKAEMS